MLGYYLAGLIEGDGSFLKRKKVKYYIQKLKSLLLKKIAIKIKEIIGVNIQKILSM